MHFRSSSSTIVVPIGLPCCHEWIQAPFSGSLADGRVVDGGKEEKSICLIRFIPLKRWLCKGLL
jgi:hypothetical protein